MNKFFFFLIICKLTHETQSEVPSPPPPPPAKKNKTKQNKTKQNKTRNFKLNRPLSHGGHVESQENKKLCFCTASLAVNSRLAEVCRAKAFYSFLFPQDSAWPPSDEGLCKCKYTQTSKRKCKGAWLALSSTQAQVIRA